MLSNEELCLRIRELYPDIGACGIDVKVEHDDQENRWIVYLNRGDKKLRTYLEPGDAELCMAGKQCVGLGIEVNQLKDSVDRMPAR